MQYRFFYKNFRPSKFIKNLVLEKLGKRIERFATKPIEAKLTFSSIGLDNVVNIRLLGGDGFNMEVTSKKRVMQDALDEATDRLENKLKKQKEKLKNHKKSHRSKDKLELVEYLDPIADADAMPIDAEDLIKLDQAMQKRRKAG